MVLQGAGKYYISAVFGFYRDISADSNSENCLSSIYNPYWIVWDANGERLVKWQTYVPKTKYIIRTLRISPGLLAISMMPESKRRNCWKMARSI